MRQAKKTEKPEGLPIGIGISADNQVVIEIGVGAEGDWLMTPNDARSLAKGINDAADSAEGKMVQ